MGPLRGRLAQMANGLRVTATRVTGEGSIVEKIESGEFAAGLGEAEAEDLAALLNVTAERLRRTRECAGLLEQGAGTDVGAANSVAEMSRTRLPLNRKERFYTGTVLPMLVASDGFAHLHRFLRLCGLDVDPRAGDGGHPLDGAAPVQLFTEYSFAESLLTAEDRKRFPDPPSHADTPDVVISGPDWLLAVEAKMFHTPSPAALNAQLRRQRVLVDYWAARFGIEPERIGHVLLVPAGLTTTGVQGGVVTWQQVRDAYANVAPQHWLGVLEEALTRYTQLRSQPSTANADAVLTGAAIVEEHADGTLAYTHMGRGGGLDGAALTADLASGSWREQDYEVRAGVEPPNRNWFPIKEFVARTAATELEPKSESPAGHEGWSRRWTGAPPRSGSRPTRGWHGRDRPGGRGNGVVG